LLKPPSVLTWVAFFLKAPPFVWGLGVLGGWSWFRSKKESWLWATLVGMAGAMMAAVFFMATALSTVQISIVYLALAALAGGVTTLPRGKIGRIFIVCLGLAALGETLLVHPHQLAYFNWFAGGSTRGYRWLADSDQDWGQWLPDLKDYWVGQGRPDLLLAYSGPADPSAYGLSFQDLISSALYVRDSREIALPQQPGRLLLATGTKMLQSEPRFFGWLKHNVQPIAQPDPCFFVYDLTDNAEALRWMAAIYNETARPTKAEWAIARADLIEKNHSF
jgi:hypothetical protein